jgi:hypothetical protein
MKEEIKARITAGNKALYSNQKMFRSKLMSRNFKLKLYWTLIRPIVTYGSETLVLTGNSTQKLVIHERKILRKIFEPTKESNCPCRIKINKELDKLIQQKNMIRFIKSQRLKWLGHLERMPKEREVTRTYKWKSFASGPIGRSKNRLEDGVRKDLQTVTIKNCKTSVLNRVPWKRIVERTKTHIRL